ncbi:transposase family protein [Streptomyces sp. NPDC056323]|uniref:transposase family protein n=1 Tax=unclassified Streptomyces TaxID=2593676 RepID=UPI0035DB8389
MIRTRSRTSSARCPRCKERSVRIHGRYERRLRYVPCNPFELHTRTIDQSGAASQDQRQRQ